MKLYVNSDLAAVYGDVPYIIVLLDPPTITSAPEAERVVKGYNATLRCHANGNPPVHYEWFRASFDEFHYKN